MEKRPRDVVAANLKALMAATPSLRLLPQITAVCGVSNGTLDRTRRAASAINVDDLARIAGAFGLEAWQMLVPELDPLHPPQIDDKLPPPVRAAMAELLQAAETLATYKATAVD